jgi:hypothetical protein
MELIWADHRHFPKGDLMKRFTILIFLLIASACAPAPDEAVSSDEPASPQTGEYAPSPADGSLTRGTVFVDTSELLTLESYPLQFNLNITGNLPTPCHKLRIAVNTPDSDNNLHIDVYSVVDPGEICIQVLEPFSVNQPLGSFPQGHYRLWVNGEMVAEFQS